MNNKINIEDLKREVLGKQLVLKGRVTSNEMFNRMELVVSNLEEPSPETVVSEINMN